MRFFAKAQNDRKKKAENDSKRKLRMTDIFPIFVIMKTIRIFLAVVVMIL